VLSKLDFLRRLPFLTRVLLSSATLDFVESDFGFDGLNVRRAC
jgi:hypothetical protein